MTTQHFPTGALWPLVKHLNGIMGRDSVYYIPEPSELSISSFCNLINEMTCIADGWDWHFNQRRETDILVKALSPVIWYDQE